MPCYHKSGFPCLKLSSLLGSDFSHVKKNYKQNKKEALQNSAVWPVTSACAQPYHPGNGSRDNCFVLIWTHQHGTATGEGLHLRSLTLRQLHRIHVVAVGWELPKQLSTCVWNRDQLSSRLVYHKPVNVWPVSLLLIYFQPMLQRGHCQISASVARV